MFKKCYIVVLIFFLVGFSNSKSNNESETGHFLSLKQVITDPNFKIDENYDYGRALYPQYKDSGLSDDFLIKRTPDVSIEPTDIKEIRISKNPFIPGTLLSYDINVVFYKTTAKEINAYTKMNLSKRIAIEFNGKILFIVNIRNPVKNELIITSANMKSMQEIERELFKISKNIIFEISSEKNSTK